jgi:hypothetical protein
MLTSKQRDPERRCIILLPMYALWVQCASVLMQHLAEDAHWMIARRTSRCATLGAVSNDVLLPLPFPLLVPCPNREVVQHYRGRHRNIERSRTHPVLRDVDKAVACLLLCAREALRAVPCIDDMCQVLGKVALSV